MKSKKKQVIMLHMHQIKNFIDDRYAFYRSFYFGEDPSYYNFKGVQKAFQVGSAVDFGIKRFYLNLMEQKDPEDGVLESNEFKTLTNKIDQTITLSLIYNYISRYHDNEDTKEYFSKYEICNWKIPFIFNRNKKQAYKNNYVVYASPDICAYDMNDELFIIEIKTSGEDSSEYSAETLDFQTMTYAWASYRWNRKVPKAIIKRTLMKPRLKQKKDENENNFLKRIVQDMSDNSKDDTYFKSNSREISLEMIQEYENYLIEIIRELDNCLSSNNKYKFWKRSRDYYGTVS